MNHFGTGLINGRTYLTNTRDQVVRHRGDGTATGVGPPGYVWDNSLAGRSPATACLQNRSDQFIVAYYDSTGLPGGPPGATDSWANAVSQVYDCVPPEMANFWPNVDANGQALITLRKPGNVLYGLENVQITGTITKLSLIKLQASRLLSPSATVMTGSVVAGAVPFTPTISIAQTGSGAVINYTGVLLAGTDVNGITNVVAQSSGSTAISLGGPSQVRPPGTGASMFYRTRE